MPNDLDLLTPVIVDLAELAYQNAVEIHESHHDPSATFIDTLVLTTIDVVLELAVWQPDYLRELGLARRRASTVEFIDPNGVRLFVHDHPLRSNSD